MVDTNDVKRSSCDALGRSRPRDDRESAQIVTRAPSNHLARTSRASLNIRTVTALAAPGAARARSPTRHRVAFALARFARSIRRFTPDIGFRRTFVTCRALFEASNRRPSSRRSTSALPAAYFGLIARRRCGRRRSSLPSRMLASACVDAGARVRRAMSRLVSETPTVDGTLFVWFLNARRREGLARSVGARWRDVIDTV